ncbi:MAG: hypothetical protein U5L01_08620 [Rheinheimera sp.]|nr:hypothetical protein [Rheinheimera sp.]
MRTEFLYGVAESTAQQRGMSSMWSEESEVDDLRKKAEQAAFKSLVPEMAKTWQRLVETVSSETAISGCATIKLCLQKTRKKAHRCCHGGLFLWFWRVATGF